MMKVRFLSLGLEPSLNSTLAVEKAIWENIVTEEDEQAEAAIATLIEKIMQIRCMLPRSLFLNTMVKRRIFADFETLLEEISEDFDLALRQQSTAQ